MKPPKFHPHVNRELTGPDGLAQKFYSERDYRKEMARHGVEPFDPNSVKQPNVNKPYERSDWAKAMHEDIKNRHGRPPGDRFLHELAKRGMSRENYEKARRIVNEELKGKW